MRKQGTLGPVRLPSTCLLGSWSKQGKLTVPVVPRCIQATVLVWGTPVLISSLGEWGPQPTSREASSRTQCSLDPATGGWGSLMPPSRSHVALYVRLADLCGSHRPTPPPRAPGSLLSPRLAGSTALPCRLQEEATDHPYPLLCGPWTPSVTQGTLINLKAPAVAWSGEESRARIQDGPKAE